MHLGSFARAAQATKVHLQSMFVEEFVIPRLSFLCLCCNRKRAWSHEGWPTCRCAKEEGRALRLFTSVKQLPFSSLALSCLMPHLMPDTMQRVIRVFSTDQANHRTMSAIISHTSFHETGRIGGCQSPARRLKNHM